jgi:hypothetical protein
MAGTDSSAPSDEIVDLLVKELTDGLTAEERAVLARAADDAATAAYRRDLQRAAAAMSLAVAATDATPLPDALRARLERDAAEFLAGAATATPPPGGAAAAAGWSGSSAANDAATEPARRAPIDAARRTPAGGWWAAAACLLLALFAWYRAPQTVFVPAPVAHTEPMPPSPQAPPPVPTPAIERAELLARADTLKIPLAATKDPAAGSVTGDVVWDPVAQRGYMRFVGLPHNDPSVHQYQIWIFDGDRDQRYPVDGGIFDVPGDGGEVIVPIHHVIPVHVAKAFAVTVEKPGGVVVSAREHVVVLAQAS